jgi:hypothetical protein
MYALIIDGKIQSVGNLPNSARRLDNGNWVMGLATASDALKAACGYRAVIDNRPQYDEATQVLERGDVFLSDPTTPVVAYTIRAKTAEELAAEADASARDAAGVRVGQAVAWLRSHAQTARNTTATTNNAVAVLNALLDDLPVVYDGLADLLEYLRADRLGEA